MTSGLRAWLGSPLNQLSSQALNAGSTMMTLRWASAAAVIGFVAYGLARRHGQDTRRRYWPRVPGRVIAERDPGYGAGFRSSFDSLVTFRTLDGTEIQGTPRGGIYLGMPVAGRSVPVWYDPRDPNLFEARIHAVDRAGSLPLLIAVLPGVLFILSFF